MNRGRFQLGQFVTLGVQCTDVNDTPTLPTAPPQMEIWQGSTIVIAAKEIPIVDRYRITARFGFRQPLDGRFAAGTYLASYTYTVGSLGVFEIDSFEVVAGGNADGAAIAMTQFDRPHARFLIWQTDMRKILYGRSPRL